MTKPENKKEVQTFLGFITYLRKFLSNMSDVSAPLRVLLEEKNEWCWEKEQDTSFNKLKDMATHAPILSYYDPKQPLTLNVDASSKGLGAVLLKNDKPIGYASRALTPTQLRYAQIEKETLAIVFGCQNSTIMYTKYDIIIRYKPGKSMYVSDTLSRMYLQETVEKLVPDIEINEIQLNAHLPISPEKYELFKKQAKSDEILQQMKKTNEEGWPLKKEELLEDLKMYWQFRNEITCIDNLMYKGLKLIIPTSLRKYVNKCYN
ncbi:unnamed protein product [Mytilus coruscus]|uniref:Reverse transcriptase/retrotransposon-derived protein RNase H-like domain-containing protein n=1 Tax=Mytilus coruscus TaxID=42192 RepID=A0A6J8BAH5_MYTCO|nr:unnamed protein product [Mytilus coruscus]